MPDVPQNYLFRLRFPIGKIPASAYKSAIKPEQLDHQFRIPFWSQYEQRDGFDKRDEDVDSLRPCDPEIENRFDFRCAWAQEGLLFTVVVAEKQKQPTWTHSTLRDADAVRLCIDTRDLKDVHRGTRFCHRLLFYPLVGESEEVAKPLAQWAPINRAKALPNAVDVAEFRMASERRKDGYAFSAFIPSGTLTGFDPSEFNRVGFHYVVRDSQFGAFVLQYAFPAPCEEDPSFWATLVLE
ncbi:MAG: hypothetical protein II561_06890 [Thermoguttaceae bacterium]|nr:hypothetical protein [Thermoguttaceae bacterium]MBQ2556263.1 hypothetical protein [Thermoguttaceae bacterium]MBQ4203391.1 hypothetical protein [Thermoguttaceae bacterium]MBQ5366473.1 hypothetical protein [Thermoguttaceae bacterium]